MAAEGWPEVPESERWLLDLLRLAEAEAAELLDDTVDTEHLVAALTRPEPGATDLLVACGLDPRRVRDFVMFISGSNEVMRAAAGGRGRRRTAKADPAPPQPRRVTPEAVVLVRDALDEAQADNASVGPRHLLVASCRRSGPPGFFGVTAAAVRQTTGLPPRPAPYAHVRRLDSMRRPRPRAVGPLVLGGGGEDVLAAVLGRLGQETARVAYVGAANPLHAAFAAFAAACARAGGQPTDTGLDARTAAFDDAVCAQLRQADVVYLDGGRAEALVDALVGTPALDALVDASDAGAAVLGSSAGAVVLGEATVSGRITEDGYERLPTLGWLRGLHVVPHWRGHAVPATAVVAGLDTLLVPELGAVWVAPGWTDLRVLDPGRHNLGARLIAGDGAPTVLPSL